MFTGLEKGKQGMTGSCTCVLLCCMSTGASGCGAERRGSGVAQACVTADTLVRYEGGGELLKHDHPSIPQGSITSCLQAQGGRDLLSTVKRLWTFLAGSRRLWVMKTASLRADIQEEPASEPDPAEMSRVWNAAP